MPAVGDPIELSWVEALLSHPDLGRTNEPITTVNYEVVVEREEPTPLKVTLIQPPELTAVVLPEGLFS